MAKNQTGWSNRLSIFWLKKNGYFSIKNGWETGGIKWTYGLNGNENSINFTIYTNPDEGDYIELRYTQTNRETDGKEDLDYKVKLTTTPCNYGGVRYWFVCPLIKNGEYCGKRVGVLYGIGKYFGCRHCGNLAYASQFRGGNFRGGSVCLPDLERAEKEIKRYYYNGKETRKYRRLIRMNEKFERDFMLSMAYLNKRL